MARSISTGNCHQTNSNLHNNNCKNTAMTNIWVLLIINSWPEIMLFMELYRQGAEMHIHILVRIRTSGLMIQGRSSSTKTIRTRNSIMVINITLMHATSIIVVHMVNMNRIFIMKYQHEHQNEKAILHYKLNDLKIDSCNMIISMFSNSR